MEDSRARFPEVEGTSLSMVQHRLPGTLAGDLNLLLLAFRQWQQRDVDSWLPLASELEAEVPGFRAYEIPVISRLYRPAAGFIDGGMRAAISDPDVRDATITLYLDREAFLDALDIRSVRAIVPMLVRRQGDILWRTQGSLTAEKASSLREALEAASLEAPDEREPSEDKG